MFSRDEIKGFLIKFGKKWFFPDFSNKVTWYVATLGAGIVITPTPLKKVFYNWLVDTFNINSEVHFTLPELSSGSADYVVGFGFVFVALSHNLFSKWLLLQNSIGMKKNEVKNPGQRAMLSNISRILLSAPGFH